MVSANYWQLGLGKKRKEHEGGARDLKIQAEPQALAEMRWGSRPFSAQMNNLADASDAWL